MYPVQGQQPSGPALRSTLRQNSASVIHSYSIPLWYVMHLPVSLRARYLSCCCPPSSIGITLANSIARVHGLYGRSVAQRDRHVPRLEQQRSLGAGAGGDADQRAVRAAVRELGGAAVGHPRRDAGPGGGPLHQLRAVKRGWVRVARGGLGAEHVALAGLLQRDGHEPVHLPVSTATGYRGAGGGGAGVGRWRRWPRRRVDRLEQSDLGAVHVDSDGVGHLGADELPPRLACD